MGNISINCSKIGLSKEFNYTSPKEIFEEYQEMTKLNPHLNIYETYDELKKTFIWGEKLEKTKSFSQPDKRANLHFVENNVLSEKTTFEYPFTL